MTLPSILQKIATDVQRRLKERMVNRNVLELREMALAARLPHPFQADLKKRNSVNKNLVERAAIIAEVKLSSPSEGVISSSLDPVDVARQYIENGATAISVLTEQDHFGGSPENLKRIRAAFPDALLLMKDFVISEEQVFEARITGADAVLLIISLLGESKTKILMDLSCEIGLSPLVEVHDPVEMKAALRMGAKLIGVNNRNLKTMAISLDVSRNLAEVAIQYAALINKDSVNPLAESDFCLIAESGIHSVTQIRELMNLGYTGFLIGTSLMKDQVPGHALMSLRRDLSGNGL